MVQEQPIIIGLTGPAGSGKTSTAKSVVINMRKSLPEGFSNQESDDIRRMINCEENAFAWPLYEFYSIRTKILGNGAKERQKRMIRESLDDLFPEKVLFKKTRLKRLTKKILAMPLPEGEAKPRAFLQNVGTLCRKIDKDCFPKWTLRKIDERFELGRKSYYNEDEFVVYIVSDVRYINELKLIKARPHSKIIGLKCDPQEIKDRLYQRDSHILSDSEAKHSSELESNTEEFKSLIDEIIDTTNISIREQSLIVERIIEQIVKEIINGKAK